MASFNSTVSNRIAEIRLKFSSENPEERRTHARRCSILEHKNILSTKEYTRYFETLISQGTKHAQVAPLLHSKVSSPLESPGKVYRTPEETGDGLKSHIDSPSCPDIKQDYSTAPENVSFKDTRAGVPELPPSKLSNKASDNRKACLVSEVDIDHGPKFRDEPVASRNSQLSLDMEEMISLDKQRDRLRDQVPSDKKLPLNQENLASSHLPVSSSSSNPRAPPLRVNRVVDKALLALKNDESKHSEKDPGDVDPKPDKSVKVHESNVHICAQVSNITGPVLNVAFVPLNGQFKTFILPMTHKYRFGRSNTMNYPSKYYIEFQSQVVSRNHLEILVIDNCVCIQDIKSSSGTFINGIRLSPPGIESKVFEVREGDIVQMGKNWAGAADTDDTGEYLEVQWKCVRFGISIMQSGDVKFDSSDLRKVEKKFQGVINSSPTGTEDMYNSNEEIVPVKPSPQEESNLRVSLENIFDMNVYPFLTSSHNSIDPTVDRKLIAIVNYSNDKVKKIAFMDNAGVELVDVSLKNWKQARTIELNAKKSLDSFIYTMRITPVGCARSDLNGYPGSYLISSKSGDPLANLDFLSKLKLMVIPSQRLSKNHPTHFTITGDSEEGRYMIVGRYRTSRQQMFMGITVLLKVSTSRLLETQKVLQISMSDIPHFHILFGSLVLLLAVKFK